jgi:RNA polymerase sigma-70 factor (ECF subfamily)
MEKETDEYYIREILKGDSGSFSPLVVKYNHLAYSLSMKILNKREDAEEAAQDAFIKAYNSLSSFQNGSTFKTWFFRIVYNTSISRLRTRKINEVKIDDVKISDAEKPERTKSSVFSLPSITTAMTANKKMEKKNTFKNLFNMYQSIFFK